MNSGGGIRTRDLRVMSPTSYQTAPPRVAELHDSNSRPRQPDQPARRGRERRESRLMAHVFVTRRCPATRSSASRAEHDVEVWPGAAARRARTLLRAASRTPRGCCRMLTDRVDAELLDAAPEAARDRQLRGRLRQHRPRRRRRRAASRSATRPTCSPTRPPTSPSRCCSRRRGASPRPASRRPRRPVAHVGARRAGSAPTSTARRSGSSASGGSARRWPGAPRASTWTSCMVDRGDDLHARCSSARTSSRCTPRSRPRPAT